MLAFLYYLIGSNISIRDLVTNRRKEKSRLVENLTKKKRSRSEEFIETMSDFYDPVNYLLETAPGSSRFSKIAVNGVLDITSYIQDSWTKLKKK